MPCRRQPHAACIVQGALCTRLAVRATVGGCRGVNFVRRIGFRSDLEYGPTAERNGQRERCDHCVATCRAGLQRIVLCCNMLCWVAGDCTVLQHAVLGCIEMYCVATCCAGLHQGLTSLSRIVHVKLMLIRRARPHTVRHPPTHPAPQTWAKKGAAPSIRVSAPLKRGTVRAVAQIDHTHTRGTACGGAKRARL
jgi:hypothetical protein